MGLEPIESEEVISFRIASANLPTEEPDGLEEVRCIRFGGSRFTTHVLVFRQAGAELLRAQITSAPLSSHYEKALRAAFPDFASLGSNVASIRASVHEASKTLPAPFDQLVSRDEIASHEVVALELRVDASGTHFWLDATKNKGGEVSLLLSAIILAVLEDELT